MPVTLIVYEISAAASEITYANDTSASVFATTRRPHGDADNYFGDAQSRAARQRFDFFAGRIAASRIERANCRVQIPGVEILQAEDTARIAGDLIGSNKHAVEKFREQGSCDISYSLPRLSRFRVNIFTQRGSCAIVMRVIPGQSPEFCRSCVCRRISDIDESAQWNRPGDRTHGFGEVFNPGGDSEQINEDKAIHILTIEDPIEFLHSHKKATVHQRELHSDTTVIRVGIARCVAPGAESDSGRRNARPRNDGNRLEAAETGHLVFSTLHTIDASKTIERIVGAFPLSDQHVIRMRFSKTFRYIISQRLVPRKDDEGRIAAIEILKSTMRTREYVERGEGEGKTLVDAMRDGSTEGMQYFDGELERMVRAGIIDLQTALAFATNAGNLRLQFADYVETLPAEALKPATQKMSSAKSPAAVEPEPVAVSASKEKEMIGGLEIER